MTLQGTAGEDNVREQRKLEAILREMLAVGVARCEGQSPASSAGFVRRHFYDTLCARVGCVCFFLFDTLFVFLIF